MKNKIKLLSSHPLDNMSYFRYVDNGEGPTKLFIGGVHGNEGKTSLNFLNV